MARQTRQPGVIVVPVSQNSKTGPIAVTYASKHTCPGDCPLNGAGCYGESGFIPVHLARLNKGTHDHMAIARQEALLIYKLPRDRPLRVHVVGDCRGPRSAGLVGRSCDWYMREGQPVWTYTHSWRKIPRRKWGDMSVLASCEDPRDVPKAWTRGYPALLIVPKFLSRRRYTFHGLSLIPCPAETKPGVTCSSCLLCTRGVYLLKSRRVIAVEANGRGAKYVRSYLEKVQGGPQSVL